MSLSKFLSAHFGAVFILAACSLTASAQVVPGTGSLVISDDFEDGAWQYVNQDPKSCNNINKQENKPGGYATNGLWSESALRGEPDVVKRIRTPDGGIEGSTASLLIRSLRTGVPGKISFEQQQDDLLMNVSTRIGGYMPTEWSPSAAVRVYIPEWQYFENRSGSQFGFRADLIGYKYETPPPPVSKKSKRPPGPVLKTENYWPGMFICYQRKEDSPTGKPYAYIVVRAGDRGQDLPGPRIDQPGWWTLGMSCTGDGSVHFYARPGVGDLTAKDKITTQYSYGYKAQSFYTIFFNVVNQDDGRSWTTPWVIDDPKIYWMRNSSPPRAAYSFR